MQSPISKKIFPTLLHSCACGSELKDNITTRGLDCSVCQYSLTIEERLSIELVSRTVYEIATEKGIEGFQLNNMLYEIDDAALPTGLLPIIINIAIQISNVLSPDKQFIFDIGEITGDEDCISSTHLFIQPNRESTMSITAALPMISYTINNLIQLSRQQDPDSMWITNLSIDGNGISNLSSSALAS